MPLAAEERPESVALGLCREPPEADLLTRVGMAILLDRVRADRDDDTVSAAGADVRRDVDAESSPGLGRLRRTEPVAVAVLETSVEARCDDERRDVELEREVTRACAVRRGVSAMAGTRRSRGTTVPMRDVEAGGSIVVDGARVADDERDVLLRLRGICDVASESTLFLVDAAAFSPRDGATTPNSPRSSLGGKAEADTCVAPSCWLLKEPTRRGPGLPTSERLVGELRGFRRGIRVGVRDLGGGVDEGDGSFELEFEFELVPGPRRACVDGEPAIVGRFALAESWSRLVRVRGVLSELAGAEESLGPDERSGSARRVEGGSGCTCIGGSWAGSDARKTSPWSAELSVCAIEMDEQVRRRRWSHAGRDAPSPACAEASPSSWAWRGSPSCRTRPPRLGATVQPSPTRPSLSKTGRRRSTSPTTGVRAYPSPCRASSHLSARS